MPAAANSDEAALATYAAALVDAVDAALAGWVVRSVEAIMDAWHPGVAVDPALLREAERAGDAARRDVVPVLRALLARDIDEQRTNPLSVLRGAVRYPTEVVAGAGVPPVVRDEFDARAFPEDVYGLTPASFADIDATLHEPALVWGAAKAHVHLTRRRAEGRR